MSERQVGSDSMCSNVSRYSATVFSPLSPLFCIYRCFTHLYFENSCYALTGVLHTAILKAAIMRWPLSKAKSSGQIPPGLVGGIHWIADLLNLLLCTHVDAFFPDIFFESRAGQADIVDNSLKFLREFYWDFPNKSHKVRALLVWTLLCLWELVRSRRQVNNNCSCPKAFYREGSDIQ